MEDTLISKKPMWRDILEIFVTAFAIYFVINIFFITSTVNQSSMYPTLEENQRLILNRIVRTTKTLPSFISICSPGNPITLFI